MRVEEWVTRDWVLPRKDLEGAWGSIVAADDLKERLMNQALLDLEVRPKLPFTMSSLHGLILLYGPPGTGKTTLARGLAQELASLVSQHKVRLVEINPHGLMSAEHGQSQQRVFDLLSEHIPSLAEDGLPTVVLLDEVESMAVSRSAASLSANPADVHRATDAVLMALDRNATDHPHVLTVATSNFTDALDDAFLSRADAAVEVPLPDTAGALAILERALADFGQVYPALERLAADRGLVEVSEAVRGLDGRRIRKVVTEALSRRRATVVDPNQLTLPDLAAAARQAHEDEGGTHGVAA